ncbi:hypothetical protein Leryth_026966 [Lithospermum erythrorhizon]|nr:hypothetical protein Leryth_026966 [Lithospermum erythrorhizon]
MGIFKISDILNKEVLQPAEDMPKPGILKPQIKHRLRCCSIKTSCGLNPFVVSCIHKSSWVAPWLNFALLKTRPVQIWDYHFYAFFAEAGSVGASLAVRAKFDRTITPDAAGVSEGGYLAVKHGGGPPSPDEL